MSSDGGRQLPAGEFSTWLHATRDALAAGGGADVPCGECTACCRSSYFIHVEPDERAALAAIPEALLFPAPGRADGHRVLGFDEDGCCPMLVDDRCSIYADRPRTCRSYDCRVFAAADILAGANDKAPVAERAMRWRFSFPTEQDGAEHAAVKSAAMFLREHAEHFAGEGIDNPSRLALLAIKAHEVFLEPDRGVEAVREAVEKYIS